MVVPAYGVEDYLPACLDSLLAQSVCAAGHDLDVVVVDDGSPDRSGEIADAYAARDGRVRVVHTENRGLGAARNEGLRHTRHGLVAFADSDDVVPPDAYAALLRQLERTGAELAVGSVSWWQAGTHRTPPWMRRVHASRAALSIEQEPRLLGDVFAWNKLFRRDFWDAAGLSWLEGHRYEDQPTTTRAYLAARRIAVVPDVVYHWRIRDEGTSITQQRGTVDDLTDRWLTKRLSRYAVLAHGSASVTKVFEERVLPGDLPRYFALIPGCDDDWWALLVSGVRELWGERSLVRARIAPVHRLTGWLVEQDRREDAAHVVATVAALPPGERVPRTVDRTGRPRIDVPGLDPASVDPAALALRDDEV
ncbi:hypothetical protein GCM10023340_12890 [Nocardioides marinquilinus]|uniref:Glycosyltransferase 2-like domain-containing protein n=1 Tax=Nocardioides marinquilinus TaxID=1210400 RepID=A0ABP9PDB1_9ACTN